jgi:plastocyanin
MRGRLRNMTMMVLMIAIVVVVAIPVGTAGASGGGGCGRPITDARGTTMRIRNYCFGPTVLRARPGDAVTFVNRDSAPHTVLGANGSWGSYRELRRGDDLTYRFARAGVYPFVCTYHPGMVGAVVVGGAGAPMAATAGAANAVVRVSPERSTQAVAVADPIPASSSSIIEAPRQIAPWGVIGLVMATIVAVGISVRRRRGREGATRV